MLNNYYLFLLCICRRGRGEIRQKRQVGCVRRQLLLAKEERTGDTDSINVQLFKTVQSKYTTCVSGSQYVSVNHLQPRFRTLKQPLFTIIYTLGKKKMPTV